MKGKLSKSDIQYRLHNEEGIIIATSHDGKLSIQNCDEIFGVVDVEKLCKQEAEKLHDKSKHEDWDVYNCLVYEDTEMIKIGFNKAMELSKDKLFTVEDMQKLMYATIDLLEQDEGVPLKFFKEFLQSLQLPAEIEVEVEMESYLEDVSYPKGEIPIFRNRLKLDAKSCLILKKTL
jgi:hypothetical protein